MIVLASASPRRRELLAQIGVRYRTVAVNVEERRGLEEAPQDYVARVAADKSRAGQDVCGDGLPVLGADTEVVLDDEVFGKPADFEHARTMLRRLSGRSHRVLSAVSLRHGQRHWLALSESNVAFRDLTDGEIEAYWASGEPVDKAGAYAIQGRGSLFIRRLEGSFSGVMGLPLFETAALLAEVGIASCVLLGAELYSP
ncbi:septum formation inhibitor Maf [Methylolobus aquaticus]|nr:septum formation inhibitor Maf [Methylolobus aquaticus]